MFKLTFYDVAMGAPLHQRNSAVNPWKSRLALNFKAIPHETNWVTLPDITKVRKGLGIPPCRKFADGTDFFTLPILIDPTTSHKIGDSFDIAVYLNKQYPNSGGDLFPPQPLDYTYDPGAAILVPLSELQQNEYPQYARFNANVDAVFSMHTILMVGGMPFDPETADEAKREFIRRAGVSSWDDFAIGDEQRKQTLVSFEKALGDLARLFTNDGPFILEKLSYADIIVGGWLRMANRTLPAEEWEQLKGWHGGVFGKLHDALEVYATVN
ncbi:unnamed protein product [Penicillium olsonii]|nr:unnamed protein product [Penicillium olsonii]CAG7933738.1 unnamed protein product [Penicillium olsonii]